MKIVPNKILTYLSVFFLCNTALAGSTPPPPAPPPGFPIDDNLVLLFLISVVFGVYKIRQYNTKKVL